MHLIYSVRASTFICAKGNGPEYLAVRRPDGTLVGKSSPPTRPIPFLTGPQLGQWTEMAHVPGYSSVEEFGRDNPLGMA